MTPDGEQGKIFVEVKYTESMEGPAARLRDRYDEVSRTSGLFINPDSPMLRSLALEQLWREHMLAQLIVDQDITSQAIFIAIGPRLNRRVMTAFRVYERELLDADPSRVSFQPFTLETFIDTLEEVGANQLSNDLRDRYCNFERVYRHALAELLDVPTPSQVTAVSQ